MLHKNNKRLRMIGVALLWHVLAIPVAVSAPGNYDSIVVFGSSYSDSGNAFILLSNPEKFGFDEACNLGTSANIPPYEELDELFIPDGSYATGGHHVTNGATWVEALVKGTGLSGSAKPALRNIGKKAKNYAVGGARTLQFPCRFNLSNQLSAYLADFPESSADTFGWQ